jgi:hypothetical protein
LNVGRPAIVEQRGVLWAVVRRVRTAATEVADRIASAMRAATHRTPLVVGLLLDAARSREELVAENALLRQQLIVAARATEHPKFAAHERGLLILLARIVPRWRDAVLLVSQRPSLRWHRNGFQLVWRWR